MTSSITVQPAIRSPMKSLESHENIPLPTKAPAPTPPNKQIQLGIEAFTKKRPADSDTSPKVKKFKTASGEFLPVQSGPDRQTVICHQCRQHTHIPLSIQCTQLKGLGKVTGEKRCVTKYCHRCVRNRYSEDPTTIKSRGDVLAGHVKDAGYAWSCPACRGICNCSDHRKRMGLEPLGYIYLRNLTDIDLSGNPLPRRARRRKNFHQPKMAFNRSFKRHKSMEIDLRRKLLKSPTTNK